MTWELSVHDPASAPRGAQPVNSAWMIQTQEEPLGVFFGGEAPPGHFAGECRRGLVKRSFDEA